MLKSLLHQIYYLSLLITLAIASVILLPSAAPAIVGPTIYQTPSGSTQLLMDNSNLDALGRMEYRTKTEDETWSGAISPTRIVQQNKTVTIYGTFQDSPGDRLSDKIFCTGNIVAVQHFAIDRFLLDVNWTVTGGKECTETGKHFKLNLSEATAHLPERSQP
jgi:hypothetical protein